MSVALRLLEAVAERGGVARELAVRLDAARGLGLVGAWQRLRAERAFGRLGDEPWDAVYREIWGSAADALGASLRELGHGFLELASNETRTRVWRQYTELDGPVSLQLALDRLLVFGLLETAGVPIPEHLVVDPSRAEDALPFLAGGACVVKPAAGTGVGSGITSGIESEGQLRRAALRALRYGPLLVERQVRGTVYRLLYLDGVLLDAVRKQPPSVVGDGRSPIAELVRAENERRVAEHGRAGFSLLKLDLDALFTLAAAGLRPSSVPAEGERVVVKSVTNQNRVADNATVPRSELGDQLVRDGAAAAAAVGLRLAGVDVITPDATRGLAEADGRVIEVNGMPGLNHHYIVVDPSRAVPVAVPILAALLRTDA